MSYANRTACGELRSHCSRRRRLLAIVGGKCWNIARKYGVRRDHRSRFFEFFLPVAALTRENPAPALRTKHDPMQPIMYPESPREPHMETSCRWETDIPSHLLPIRCPHAGRQIDQASQSPVFARCPMLSEHGVMGTTIQALSYLRSVACT
jgi:hypothetical protein